MFAPTYLRQSVTTLNFDIVQLLKDCGDSTTNLDWKTKQNKGQRTRLSIEYEFACNIKKQKLPVDPFCRIGHARGTARGCLSTTCMRTANTVTQMDRGSTVVDGLVDCMREGKQMGEMKLNSCRSIVAVIIIGSTSMKNFDC